ncbi:unnamed protein product [Adineta ricciae]|uniref:C2H2-type domain-containing protein n=3 Tax=Adineta ricciae TaxID=249248 RepID=A0A814YWY3_ADIRI|nr:unnamed protein product [Adineta ricciae]CAF1235097.1 unnamed protein product [Adineta ricciae]
MATAINHHLQSDLKYLTDCMYFISGYCKLDDKCRYRHCREAINQIETCSRWPATCRNVTCLFRHPTVLSHQVHNPKGSRHFVSFFWDIENVPIPRGQRPFDIVQRIREKLVIEPGLQEADFSCYCNSATISEMNLVNLSHANVRIVHVPDRKSGAADRQIMLDLARFERIHHPPATIVLISGDIDFVGALSALRHRAGFLVIVIHNKPAKEELKATVHEHYPWELFTLPSSQRPVASINDSETTSKVRVSRAQSTHSRRRHSSRNRSLRRRDQSPYVPVKTSSVASSNQVMKKNPCPKCSTDFESIQSLQQHQSAKKHLFTCPVCNDTFFTEISQTQHQKDKNHYVSDYRCQQCNRLFAKSESLNQHQQDTGHPDVPPPPTIYPKSILRRTQLPPPSFVPQTEPDPFEIILGGIEALKNHYIKRSTKPN